MFYFAKNEDTHRNASLSVKGDSGVRVGTSSEVDVRNAMDELVEIIANFQRRWRRLGGQHAGRLLVFDQVRRENHDAVCEPTVGFHDQTSFVLQLERFIVHRSYSVVDGRSFVLPERLGLDRTSR